MIYFYLILKIITDLLEDIVIEFIVIIETGGEVLKRNDVESLTLKIAEPIVEELEIEIVDIEYIKEGPYMYLRIYIDKDGGVNLDDCQRVSEKVSVALDEKDPISENYFLEVSSPGIDRPLKNDKDLKRSIGKDIEMSLYKMIDGKKKLTGKLLNYDDDNIYVEYENSEERSIERNVISKINLAVNF